MQRKQILSKMVIWKWVLWNQWAWYVQSHLHLKLLMTIIYYVHVPRVMPVVMPIQTTATTADADLTRSLILAVSVCYHARLSERTDYEEGVSEQFTAPLALPGGEKQFRNEIKW